MSTTIAPASAQEESIGARFRNLGMGALFALVLIIPKILHIRRDRCTWMAFRVLLAMAGAALVILPLSLWNSWTAGVAGVILFLAAILLPAEKPDTTVADTAARLGALVVVNGGEYQPENDRPIKTQLFVGPERIWALDAGMQPLLVIATGQMISALAAESGGDGAVETFQHGLMVFTPEPREIFVLAASTADRPAQVAQVWRAYVDAFTD